MIEIWVLIMLLKGTKENVYRIWKSEGISSRLGSNIILFTLGKVTLPLSVFPHL